MSAKDEAIRVRVTPEMRAELDLIAARRGESVSVVIRDALRDYLAMGAPDPGPAAKAAALNDGPRPTGLADQIVRYHAAQLLAQALPQSASVGEPSPSAAEGSAPPAQPPTARRKR